MRRGRIARAGETTVPVAQTTTVGGSRRLSEGALVQASVRARLIGIPILRLDAAVVLMPATTTVSSVAVAGDGLAEAVRSINEGEEILTQLRRNARR